MKHLILGLMLLSVVVAAVMGLKQCSGPAPETPGIELDVDIDRAKPRKTLTPKPAPKVSAKAPQPKGTKR